MIIKGRLASIVVPALALVALMATSAGCSDGTSATSAEEKAFKDHDPKDIVKPPADAMKPAGGRAFIGESRSSSIGGTSPAPPPNGGAIPGAGGK